MLIRIAVIALGLMYVLRPLGQELSPYLVVDQFGYTPEMEKIAVLRDPVIGHDADQSYMPGNSLELRRATDDIVVYSGAPEIWNNGDVHGESGDRGWWFDFSSVTAEGRYYVYDPSNDVRSPQFDIADNAYDVVMKDALRMFYYNRCNAAKLTAHVDEGYADGMNFLNPGQDAEATFIESPGDVSTSKDLRGGWFDAGDYNKYSTFTETTLHDLLWAYRENPHVFGDENNIPESGNGVPDILDEVVWELEWLYRMSNPDGSVHIKMGSANYAENVFSPPSSNVDPRYYGPTCTSASITVASVFAHAATVLAPFEEYSDLVAQLDARAVECWNYVLPALQSNSLETDCDDGSIVAGDADRDEAQQRENAVAAAIYLLERNGDLSYATYMETNLDDVEEISVGFWGGYDLHIPSALLLYAQLDSAEPSTAASILDSFTEAVSNDYENFYGPSTWDLYLGFMPWYSYHWGSNSAKAGYGNANGLALIHTDVSVDHRNQIARLAHYLHGVNPQGLAYLSNMAHAGVERSATEIYHAWFNNGTEWDNTEDDLYGPAPGFLTGGPNQYYSVPDYSPPYGQPNLKSYLDFNDGFPANSYEISEPAIYYQAAYIRMLAHLIPASNPNEVGFGIPEDIEVFEVFPNPTEGVLWLDKPLSKEPISLYDAQGRLLEQFPKQRTRLDLSTYPDGIYLLRYLNHTQRILLNKSGAAFSK